MSENYEPDYEQWVHKPVDFDKGALERFLKDNIEDFPKGDEEFTIKQFKTGTSNPTYYLKKGGKEFVLRQKAIDIKYVDLHKVYAEYKVMSALHGLIPVPKPLLYSADSSIVGTEFYIMEYLKGRIFPSPLLPDFSAVERKTIFESMVSVLAKLHELDLGNLQLTDTLDYSKGNFVKQRVEFLARDYKTNEATVRMPNTNADGLIEWLLKNIPDDGVAPVILHGDLRVQNLMIHENKPSIVAVLDWEGACASHPFDDLAYLCMGYHWPKEIQILREMIEYTAEGIPTEEELLKFYCQKRGLTFPLENFNYFLVLNFFLVTCRVQGLAAKMLKQYGAVPDQLQPIIGMMYHTLKKARELAELDA